MCKPRNFHANRTFEAARTRKLDVSYNPSSRVPNLFADDLKLITDHLPKKLEVRSMALCVHNSNCREWLEDLWGSFSFR